MYRLPDSLNPDEWGPEAFLPGDLERHKRYRYRGVIVSVDPECLAEDSWYQSNQTQPRKNQPWYHVLVDNSAQTTYTAHSNIEIDSIKTRVSHPLVNLYFDHFENGRYIRNDKPWPA